ncbi:MAG TPA: nuclear transport factor 2 family protein [Conexibacter sp.]|nr:nuclear transport factor 2 family protein [Conexibacter sp.]
MKAAFVEQFRTGWAGGADTLVELFLPDLLDPDVVMTQPLLPPARGHDGFAAFFEVLFGAIPDLRGTVRDWRPTDDGVEIDFTLHGTLGGQPFELPTTDRIVLRDGRVLERHAKTDPRALVATIARHPLAAIPLLTGPLRAQPPLERALAGLALGRVALGAPGRLAPRAMARAFGAGRAASPELDYMTRVFGVRAIALGLGWLSSDGAARRRWQRLAFMCDVSDTLAGIGHLRRRDLPRGSALATTALTGAYALVGGLRVAQDARARRPV